MIGRSVLVVSALVGGGALAACGDDGGTSSEDAAFCDARVAIEAEFLADEPDQAAIDSSLDEMDENAPADIESDVTTVTDGLRENAGDPFEDPEFVDAIAAVDEYSFDNCDIEQVEVAGLDFSFEGIPEEVDAGVVGFKFTNDGVEPHELLVFRIDDDADLSLAEIVELPGREADELVTTTAVTFAESDETSYTIAEFEAGRYGVACFVETDDGTPHTAEGMLAEFEVT